MPHVQDLLTTRQAADRLGVNVSTISRWVLAGRLSPALRGDGQTGGMWFRAADIDGMREAAS